MHYFTTAFTLSATVVLGSPLITKITPQAVLSPQIDGKPEFDLTIKVDLHPSTNPSSAPGFHVDPDIVETRCQPDFCAGTKNSTQEGWEAFVCGDLRLGPVNMPLSMPLQGMVGGDSTYRRFGGLCPGEFLRRYTVPDHDSWWVYPTSPGFLFDITGQPATFNMTLEPGDFVDRFGGEGGKYLAPAGTAYAQRSIPPSNLNFEPGAKYPFNYHVYEVARTMVVEAGPAAKGFGQPGLGLQYVLQKNVSDLVREGMLFPVDLEKDPNW